MQMFELLPRGSDKVVGVHAIGKLTDDDYQLLLPKLEERIDKYGRICVLVDMEGFEGWTLHAAWDDFAFGMTHWHHFDMIALIGDEGWEEMAARLTNMLMRGEVRFFDLDQREAAWDWIRG